MGGTRKLGSFSGRLVMLGFGSIGQAMLPLLFDTLGIKPAQVKVIKASEDTSGAAEALGVEVLVQPLSEGNYEAVLEPLVGAGDFLLNLSVDVASLALVRFCWKRNGQEAERCRSQHAEPVH